MLLPELARASRGACGARGQHGWRCESSCITEEARCAGFGRQLGEGAPLLPS